MKIAVISDIHANLFGLEAIAEDLGKLNPDKLVFLGDLVMLGARPAEVFSLMESLKPDLWIRGNTDAWLDEINEEWNPPDDRMKNIKEAALWCRPRLKAPQWDRLASQPITGTLDCGSDGGLITFCHGSPSSFSDGILPENSPEEIDNLLKDMQEGSNILVCGHTHTRFLMNHRGRTIVNFGSVSIPRKDLNENLARFGIITVDENISFQPRESAFGFTAYCNELDDMQFPAREMILTNIARNKG